MGRKESCLCNPYCKEKLRREVYAGPMRHSSALVNSYLVLNDGNDVPNSLKIPVSSKSKTPNIHLLSQI